VIVFSFPIHRQLLIQRLTGTIPSIAIRRTRVVLPAWRGPATKTTDVGHRFSYAHCNQSLVERAFIYMQLSV
jgi:hypothetical protein